MRPTWLPRVYGRLAACTALVVACRRRRAASRALGAQGRAHRAPQLGPSRLLEHAADADRAEPQADPRRDAVPGQPRTRHPRRAPAATERRLRRAAQAHTDSMAFGDYFEHVGPGGQTPLARMRAAGYISSSRSATKSARTSPGARSAWRRRARSSPPGWPRRDTARTSSTRATAKPASASRRTRPPPSPTARPARSTRRTSASSSAPDPRAPARPLGDSRMLRRERPHLPVPRRAPYITSGPHHHKETEAMGVLDGKSAIVTGSARGIGRATAELLVAQGAQVLINDLDGDVAEQAAGEIQGETAVFAGDLTKPGAAGRSSCRRRSTRSARSTSSSTTPATRSTRPCTRCPTSTSRRCSTSTRSCPSA